MNQASPAQNCLQYTQNILAKKKKNIVYFLIFRNIKKFRNAFGSLLKNIGKLSTQKEEISNICILCLYREKARCGLNLIRMNTFTIRIVQDSVKSWLLR